jgi:DNA-binding XRE family transcriptional regulator
MVDGVSVGALTGGMRLRFLTVATDAIEKSENASKCGIVRQAIIVLADTRYYESLENAMKIRKYVKQRNVAQLPKSVQDIIRDQQDEAASYESTAMDDLRKAIDGAAFYVDGEHLEIKGGDAKSKIDQALEYLVSHVYSELDLITKFADTDEDIYSILNGTAQQAIGGLEPNRDAAIKN